MKLDGQKISLKELAMLEGGIRWKSVYNTIRSRVARNEYSTYKKINGIGYVDIQDSSIPDSVRLAYSSNNNHEPVEDYNFPSAVFPAKINDDLNELSSNHLEIALARSAFIKLYTDFSNNSSVGKVEAKNKFIAAYNEGALPELLAKLGQISFKTAERWKSGYEKANKDYRVLAPRYKKDRTQSVPSRQAEILIKLVLNPNRPLISEVIRKAKDIFIMKRDSTILHDSTYRRFLLNWKKNNYPDWVFFREGEHALDNKVIPYIERDYNKISVGDIIVADGHTLNFEIIDPYTGKPKRMTLILFFDMKSSHPLGWEIAASENSQAIAVALRRAILCLGKYPKVVYIDNGRAFCSKLLNGENYHTSSLPGIFERIGAKVINAIPYHAQSKTIERFFKTFADIERAMPSYSGTNIDNKPARMNRGEKLHNKLFDKTLKNIPVDIYTAHRAVAWFFDEYDKRKQKEGHLKGLTPLEAFEAGKGPGVDKGQLNFLMMSLEVKTIYRNGIKLFGTSYYHEALYGRQLDNVLIRYDVLETDSIFVYEQSGELICEASRVDKVHPAANILGTDDDLKVLQQNLERKERLKSSTVSGARKFLAEEVYPEIDKQLKNIEIIPLEVNRNNETQSELKGSRKKKRNLLDSWNEDNTDFSKNIFTISKVVEK